MRAICLLGLMFFPWRLKRWVYCRVFGFDVSRDAYVGFSYVDVQSMTLRDGAAIGAFTVIRNLHCLDLGVGAKVGTFNWVFGMCAAGGSFAEETQRRSSLVLGAGAAVTSRHLLDCIDSIEIGMFTTVAGFRSQFLTHGIDLSKNRQGCAPIKIGSYCFIGTGVIVLKGVCIPDRSVIGAGSVVTRSLESPGYFYAGNPATARRSVSEGDRYFSRSASRVL